MTYVIGGYGPWTADDAGVVCDGFLVNGNLLVGPTCDGVGPTLKPHDRTDHDVLLGRILRPRLGGSPR